MYGQQENLGSFKSYTAGQEGLFLSQKRKVHYCVQKHISTI
jgi:hypothetical protein